MRKGNKVDNPDLKNKAVSLVQEACKWVTIDYVSYNLNLSWSTARTMLMQLVADKKLIGERTTQSWIFKPVNMREGDGHEL